jgi:apolipoprotein N-acyltransferase
LEQDKAPTAKETFLCGAAAAICYLLPTVSSALLFTIPLYFYFLLRLSDAKSIKAAVYSSLLSGFFISAIHMRFFYNIFAQASIALWLIMALWTTLFVLSITILKKKISNWQFALSAPLLFFVFEYINCEIYPLKFSWLSAGYLFYDSSLKELLPIIGIYGLSLLIFLLVSFSTLSKHYAKIIGGLCLLILICSFLTSKAPKDNSGPIITGVQMEFPDEMVIFKELDKALKKHPDTNIFMLSEYTFMEGIPEEAFEWCKANKKYLLAGAKIYTKDKESFRNTAIVINPEGKVEFSQVKSVPIQFFNDGIPAQKQKLWNSPWGTFGICICYDLSYSKVTDRLIDLGAEALLVPTMDVISWGKNQHKLHSRVAPIRAAEYRIPIFKVSSSGISQSVNHKGQTQASASYPGQYEVISTRLSLNGKGSKPFDRLLFIPAIVFVILIILLRAFRKETLKESTT